MRDDEIIARAILRALRVAASYGDGDSQRRGRVSLRRLEAEADGALRAARGYGIAPGFGRAVVLSFIRDGRVGGRIEGGVVEVDSIRLKAPRKEPANENGSQGSWGWEK